MDIDKTTKRKGVLAFLLILMGLEIFLYKIEILNSINILSKIKLGNYLEEFLNFITGHALDLASLTIALLGAGLLFQIGWMEIKKSLRSNLVEKLDILEDSPKSAISSDELHRETSLKSIVGLLKQNFQYTFVIHIDGKWGSGKTSLVNFVKEHFGKDPAYVFMDFNPSTLSKEKSLMGSFFDELSRRDPSLHRELDELKSALATIVNKKVGMDLLHIKSRSIEEMKLKLIRKLEKKGKKLIICIDDIDRLGSKEEILETLKIVREFQFDGAKHIFFILPFDLKTVEGHLSLEKTNDPNYFEKICNITMKVIAPTNLVEEHFLKNLTTLSATIDLRPHFLGEMIEAYKWLTGEKDYSIRTRGLTDVTWNLRTIRQSNLLLNALIPMLKINHKEVNAKDFVLTTVLKVFYPKIYVDLIEHGGMYIRGNFSSSRTSEEADKTHIKAHIEKLTDEHTKTVVLRILFELFPAVAAAYGQNPMKINAREGAASQQVAHSEYFERYFFEDTYNIKIKDGEFFEIIDNWNEIPKEEKCKIFAPTGNYWENKNPALVLLERHVDLLDETFLEDLTMILPRKEGRSRSNYYDLSRVVYKIVDKKFHSGGRNVNRETTDKLKLKLYRNIINKAPLGFVNAFVLGYWYKTSEGWNEVDRNKFYKELRKELGKRIEKELLDKNVDIFKFFGETYYAVELLFNSGISNQVVNKYLQEKFRKSPKKFAEIIIFIKNNRQDEGTATNQQIINLIGLPRLLRWSENAFGEAKGKEKKACEEFISFVEEEIKKN